MCTLSVALEFHGGQMRRAIGFDNQHALATNEITEIESDRFLAREFEAVQAAIAQASTELRFGLSLRLAKLSRALGVFTIGPAHSSTSPSP